MSREKWLEPISYYTIRFSAVNIILRSSEDETESHSHVRQASTQDEVETESHFRPPFDPRGA